LVVDEVAEEGAVGAAGLAHKAAVKKLFSQYYNKLRHLTSKIWPRF
jgi:hypothetical protein